MHQCNPRTNFRQILYNGVDIDNFDRVIDRAESRARLTLPPDKTLITYVARFMPHKNYRQLLRLAARFQESNASVHFALAGSHGTDLDQVQEIAKRAKNVSVLIGLPDVSELLLSSDIFFFPSLEEGFGVVALEAACAGLPIAATRLPSICEALAPSHRDFTFEPDNDDEAYEKLCKLVHSQTLRSSLSREGREWSKKFSIESSVNAIAQVYETLGDAKTAPAGQHLRGCTNEPGTAGITQ